MAVQNGKDLLIKVDQTGEGDFVTLAGLRATRLSFNAQTVDVTSLESDGGGGGEIGCHFRIGRVSRCQYRCTGAADLL